MADPVRHDDLTLTGHLREQVATLKYELAQNQIDVAAWRAAEDTRVRRYYRTVEEVGQPPEELTYALRNGAGGWRAAWIPFEATGLIGAYVLLPGQGEPINPYAEAEVWYELARPTARHLTAVRDDSVPQVEHRDLPRPLIAYVRNYGSASRIVVASELDTGQRAMAVRAIWHLWRVHHPGRIETPDLD